VPALPHVTHRPPGPRRTWLAWFPLLIACTEPLPGGGGAEASERSPADTGTTPYGLTTHDGLIDIPWFDVVDLSAAREDWCWRGIELTVEAQYWRDFARYVQNESATEFCSPVGWTAVHEGQCILVQITCFDDPRDPTFLDCSELPECCDLADALGGCG
jgi:hypothetical protein